MSRNYRHGTVDLPNGVHRVVARKHEYFYYQEGRGTPRQGPRIKLPNDSKSPEFWIALRNAQGLQSGAEEVKTFGAVCDMYETSDHFIRTLSKETQAKYRGSLRIARAAWGSLAADGLRPKYVRALLDTLAGTPGTANNVLGLLRALSSWGLERGHFEQSITEGVKPYKSDGGHKPWTAAQCAAAEKHLTGMLRRGYFLLRYTGQRGSDVVRLGATYIDDGGFRLSQRKTGREVWCPIEEQLAAEMATWPRRPGPYLQQKHGKHYGRELLDDHFREARDKIPDLAGTTLHGLRGTRVIELRNRGDSTTQIQDQVGMSLAMIERYCRFADKKANGKAAVIALAERRKNAGL
jgi:integrase